MKNHQSKSKKYVFAALLVSAILLGAFKLNSMSNEVIYKFSDGPGGRAVERAD